MSSTTVVLEYTMAEVWRSVVDVGTTMIGIFGEGGVGKTTLLKHIHSKLTTTSPLHFDTVIWVTVSRDLSIEKVQDDIWKRIGVFNVEWVDKTFQEKANAIFEVLSRKKFVLLLDDLGETLDLTELGVPDLQENNCKVIFTTRSWDLCKRMRAQATLPMIDMEWEYAWELFKNKVGEDRLSDPKMLDLAQTIARTCQGLPMLLCTVGRAMASMTTCKEWAIAAAEWLQSQVSPNVFTLLQLCFACLGSEVRSYLLYFCLFPEDFTIPKNELIDFWICEQLLGHYAFGEVDVLDLGYKTLDALIGACLLEEEQPNSVKLLDLIREFGSETRVFSDQILTVASRWEMRQILSIRNSIRNLRDYVPDNIFITFLLNHNPFIILNAKFNLDDISRENSDHFTSIDESPQFQAESSTSARFSVWNLASSISKFVTRRKKKSTYKREEDFYQIGNIYQFKDSLTVLDLSNSGVEKIPKEIAELTSLEYLNLSHTWIDHLPIMIKNLVKLKCLNLEYNDQLRVIPKQLILELSCLRILKMFRCGFSVEEVVDNILSLNNMDIDALFCLEHLKVLSITITCALALNKFFSSHKFLRCIQSLSLEVFWRCKSLDISPLAAMENLLVLEIHQFENLNELKCYPHSFELERGRRSFEKLREITVDECSRLVDLTWVVLVPNLAILKVQNCERLEEVISSRTMDESSNGDNCEPFAKLEILTLENLLELKSIYWKALAFRHLKKMQVIDCCLLKKLPLDSRGTNANELLIIEAQEDWWENIEWEDDDSRVTFSPCFKPTV